MSSFIKILKSMWILFWSSLLTLILFIPITLSAFLSTTGNMAFNFCKMWTWVGLRIGFVHLSTRGRNKVKDGQSYIIVSNHQSLYDIPALMNGLDMQFRWIIKKELLKIPLFGYALYASRHVFIDRTNTNKSIESINKAMERLPKGVSVMFFAEGTRSFDGKVGKFKKGGFIIAIQRGLPILPVTVNGSHKFMPDKNTMAFYPGPIEVVIGDPIETSMYTKETINELIDKTRKAIVSNHNPDFPKTV